MAAFGNLTLLVSFVVATMAGVASFVGIRRDSERLLRAGRAAVYLLAATLSMAIATMVHAFMSSDFSIKYVQHYSEAAQPFAYKITAVWGGLTDRCCSGSFCWPSARRWRCGRCIAAIEPSPPTALWC